MDDALVVTAPIDPVLGQRLADTLAETVELERTFEAQHRLAVHPQSRLAFDSTAGNAASGFNTASIALIGALDHLRTWYQLIASVDRHPLPVFSPYSLARGAYEAALLTLWLLDPTVDSGERIGRGYAAQLRSLEDLHRFQQDVGMTGAGANAPALHQRLFDSARASGYVTTTANGSERLIVAVPSMVQLFNTYDRPTAAETLPSGIYRLLSGHAHGREWAMIRGAVTADLAGYDTDMYAITSDLTLQCHLADLVAAATARAVAAHVRYRTQPAV